MTKCWIKTDFVPEDSKGYITEGKWYEVQLDVEGGGGVRWDGGDSGYTALTSSAHLNYKDWQVHYGERPPEKVVTHVSTDYNLALSIYDRLSEEKKLNFKHYVMCTWPHLNKDILEAEYIIRTMVVGVEE